MVPFERGVVNVISGASKTGKSAVIPIIDYCLGSEKCAIPVGVIREQCSWFGVVVETAEGQKLLARREPGDQKSTDHMFVIEQPEVEIPDTIGTKNSNVAFVKAVLDRLAGLSPLDFDPQSDNGFKSRISFRDLTAFMFQPQNIVANPDVLFFKADTTEHREKLKTIFPYVLNAVTPRILALRQQLDQLERQLRRKENELRNFESATSQWMSDGRIWLQQAIELGLTPSEEVPSDWNALVDRLRGIARKGTPESTPTIAGIASTLDRLSVLRKEASDLAAIVTGHRFRLNELRRLQESSESYGNAMALQRDRLSIATWLRERMTESADPLSTLNGEADQRIAELCDTLEKLQIQMNSHPMMSGNLDAELLRQLSVTEESLSQLTLVRREIASYEAANEERKKAADRFRSAERFLGSLDQMLLFYDQSDSTSPLKSEIADLNRQISDLREEVSERHVSEKIERAINTLQSLTGRIVPLLDAEWPDAPIRLNIRELTVQVTRESREDYLWEIGSGANWLAYHVAVTLALQLFFLSKDRDKQHHPVPGLLIYDQPSQVYFPKRSVQLAGPDEDEKWKDQDIVAVRKVFEVLARAVTSSKAKLQVIVLDHAHSEVWGNIKEVHPCEEWWGKEKLVPIDWLTGEDGNDGFITTGL